MLHYKGHVHVKLYGKGTLRNGGCVRLTYVIKYTVHDFYCYKCIKHITDCYNGYRSTQDIIKKETQPFQSITVLSWRDNYSSERLCVELLRRIILCWCTCSFHCYFWAIHVGKSSVKHLIHCTVKFWYFFPPKHTSLTKCLFLWSTYKILILTIIIKWMLVEYSYVQ